MIEFKMPSLGADMEAGILREWKVKPGDTVKRGDIIAEVEAQKGIIEIEVFDDGIIDQLIIGIDEKVPVGTVMALIRGANEKPGPAPSHVISEIKEEVIKAETEKETEPKIEIPVSHEIKATPLAKRMAVENNIDIRNLKGSGENGSITKEDIEQAIAQKTSAASTAAQSPSENVRMAVAAAMSRSNREIPHYYLEKKILLQAALSWLAEYNKQQPLPSRLLPVVVFIKAVALALKEVPELNAVWENGLQMKSDIHIGFVVSLRGGGIIVPAIHQADKKNLQEIMSTLNDLIPRARALKLRSSELSDSTVTLTNLGEGGADKVYGIIYPPQVAIIGFGNTVNEPNLEEDKWVKRPFVYATLAGDHRASDGLSGSRFLAALNDHLQKPELL